MTTLSPGISWTANCGPFSFRTTAPRKNPLRVRDDELFTWYTGTLSPQAVEERLNYLCDVLDRIPARTWAAG
ncbi:hypothetical protein [Streptomyces sp. KL116D]|uniref:hypothetical protein n=1 Tax=Streptomyces sp. KL116D TaxID=3045152 RepID=UPI00355862E4